MREAVAARITRGKVECRVTFTPVSTGAPNPSLRTPRRWIRSPRPRLRWRSASRRRARCRSPRCCIGRACSPTNRFRPTSCATTSMALLARAVSELDQTRAPRRRQARSRAARPPRPAWRRSWSRPQPLLPGAVKAFQEKLAAEDRRGGRLRPPTNASSRRSCSTRRASTSTRNCSGSPRTWPKSAACSTRAEPAASASISSAGAQSRGEHARLQVGGQRDDAHLGGAQGADRADARAGAEHRIAAMTRQPLHRRAPVGGRQDQPGERAARARADIELSVSHTTRAPRPGEVDGREYHFVVAREVRGDDRRGRIPRERRGPRQLLRHSQALDRARAAGDHDMLLEIDWQGARQVRKLFPGDGRRSSSCRPRLRSCAGGWTARGKDSAGGDRARAWRARARRSRMSRNSNI